ncbi:MAG: 4-phosphoerythronate dehydrogenase, partial [Candidatus Marinimicrobia bacterium]|nr:4-phosphoerythronate dehydrogenase [Candidatus Neomarinimicrobiota bacterium]
MKNDSPTVKTVCAASVLWGAEAFGRLGPVTVLPDREIGPAQVRDAHLLAIRSKTPVNRALLAGGGLRFVGTATAGYDHLDLAALEQAGTAWTAAAGCNANSVAEYFVCALLCLANRHGWALDRMTLGVIGVGQVGRRVARNAERLGMRVLRNDPPLARATGNACYVPLAELQAQADILTFHVPLTQDGPDPTYHLGDYRFFERVRPGCVIFNAARGEVVDPGVLLEAQRAGAVSRLVLDVWEPEPDYPLELLAAADLATPHIAGYSFDGKFEGTRLIYEEACRFLEVPADWTPPPLPAPAKPVIEVDAAPLSFEEALWQ